MKTFITITIALLALTSCGPQNTIRPVGIVQTKEFTFEQTCNSLTVTNTFNVILDTSIPLGTAIISTDKAVMEQVQVKSNPEELLFRLKNRWKVSSTPIDVRMSPGNLDSFHAIGASEITSEEEIYQKEIEVSATGISTICLKGLQAKEIEAEAIGTSSILLEGKTEELSLTVTGLSQIDTRDLQCVEAEVEATGTSSLWINALQSITGRSVGMSKIYYLGEPRFIDIQSIGMSSTQALEK